MGNLQPGTRAFEDALDEWITRGPYEEEVEEQLPSPETKKRRDGRESDVCNCSAYKFPHRAGSGKCRNQGWTSHKRPRRR